MNITILRTIANALSSINMRNMKIKQTHIDFSETATSKKDNYLNKLIKIDNNYSITGFFLLVSIFVGMLLLAVPVYVLINEAYHNHTITTDLNGMASYITAVTAIFASGGFTYALTTWSNNKYGNANLTKEKTIETNHDDSDKDNESIN